MANSRSESPGISLQDRIAKIPRHAQQSVFCGPTGFLLFILAVVSYIEHKTAAAVYKSRSTRNDETTPLVGFKDEQQNNEDGLFPAESKKFRDERLYQAHIKASEKAGLTVWRNTVPFCEMLLVPPAVFLVVHFAIKYNWGIVPTFLSQKMMIAYCIAVCGALMFLFCLSLRLFGLREDCCENPVDAPIHAAGRQFVVFSAKKKAEFYAELPQEAIRWAEVSGWRSMLINFLTLPLRAVTVPVFLFLSAVSFMRFPLDLLCAVIQANCADGFRWRDSEAKRSLCLGREYLGAAFYNLLSVATLGLAEPVLRSRLYDVKVVEVSDLLSDNNRCNGSCGVEVT